MSGGRGGRGGQGLRRGATRRVAEPVGGANLEEDPAAVIERLGHLASEVDDVRVHGGRECDLTSAGAEIYEDISPSKLEILEEL